MHTKVFPLEMVVLLALRAWVERSLEIRQFLRGTQIQHADGRVVRSI